MTSAKKKRKEKCDNTATASLKPFLQSTDGSMELERANKEWLTFIQQWLNTLKKSRTLTSQILQQFEEKSPALESHLKSISSWLKTNVSLFSMRQCEW